jgi:predicted alpha/beta hydrolase family esterase
MHGVLAALERIGYSADTKHPEADVSRAFLILHGWGGNKPQHWQEHLAAALIERGETVIYPKMPSPTAPVPAAWLSTLHDVVTGLPPSEDVTVLAHSLGAINWLHYTTAVTARIARRVLLAAPPYVIPGLPPLDAPGGVDAFFPPPLHPEAVRTAAEETVLICGDNDDYATAEQTRIYAERLQIPLHVVPGGGHLSPWWGYGNWPWVLDWCLGTAELPPVAVTNPEE